MNTTNKVSATLKSTEVQKVINYFELIKGELPFLLNLSIQERKMIRKMGPKSTDYVESCLVAAKSFPGMMPADFDVTEFANDVELVSQMRDLYLRMGSLYESLGDTLMAVGSDAMTTSDEVYALLKRNTQKDNNVKLMLERIGERYKNQGVKKKSSTKTNTPNENN